MLSRAVTPTMNSQNKTNNPFQTRFTPEEIQNFPSGVVCDGLGMVTIGDVKDEKWQSIKQQMLETEGEDVIFDEGEVKAIYDEMNV